MLVFYDVFLLFMSILLDEIIEFFVDKVFCNNWFNLLYDLMISKNDFIELLIIVMKE